MCVPQVFAELGHFTAVHFRHVRHPHAKLSASYGIYQLSVIALASCYCVHNVNDIKLSLLALLFCFVWPAVYYTSILRWFLCLFRPCNGLHVIERWNCRFILLNQSLCKMQPAYGISLFTRHWWVVAQRVRWGAYSVRRIKGIYMLFNNSNKGFGY